MYKIMLLVRDSETKPLWTEYQELFDRYTRNQLRVVQDMSYTLDILFD